MHLEGTGYDWAPLPGMMPALLGAAELRHTRVMPSGKQQRDSWVLDYNFTAGEHVRLASPSAPWHARPAGVAHLYPPYLPYWEAPAPDGEPLAVHCVYLLFAESGILRLEELLAPRTRYARFLDDAGMLGALLNQLVRIGVEEQAAGYWSAHALFFQIIALLHRAAPCTDGVYRIMAARQAAEQTSPLMHRVKTYFMEHLAERITLAEVAQYLDMSVSALSHRYREEVGESPMTTLKRERITLTKTLLAKGYHLNAIANRVGFYDEFHLSKAFKQVEGVTPRIYRKLIT